MKIAAIADIHSNIEALNKVLEHIKSNNCDEIICLGDLIGYSPHPNEVIEKIKELDIPTTMGNHDEAIGFYLSHCGCNVDSKAKLLQSQNSLKWTSENTTEENKAWLRQLPDELLFQYGEKTIYATHASPNSINEYIYSHEERRIQEIVEEADSDILLLGHTHIPFIICQDERVVINPGSVGRPKDGDCRASYAILELNDGINAEIIRVEYDIEKVIANINQTDLFKEFGDMLSLGKIIE